MSACCLAPTSHISATNYVRGRVTAVTLLEKWNDKLLDGSLLSFPLSHPRLIHQHIEHHLATLPISRSFDPPRPGPLHWSSPARASLILELFFLILLSLLSLPATPVPPEWPRLWSQTSNAPQDGPACDIWRRSSSFTAR